MPIDAPTHIDSIGAPDPICAPTPALKPEPYGLAHRFKVLGRRAKRMPDVPVDILVAGADDDAADQELVERESAELTHPARSSASR